jgi:LysM repeat protein
VHTVLAPEGRGIDRRAVRLRSRVGHAIVPAIAVLAAAAPPAPARVAHTVEPGETLWSIAAANNFTTRALAAANGLPAGAHIMAGSTIWVPTVSEAASALAGRGHAAGPLPEAMGGYVVRSGDSLSAIAARSGATVRELASLNGLDPAGTLLIGTRLRLPGGTPVAPPAGVRPRAVSPAAPEPTAESVTPSQVEDLALQHGSIRGWPPRWRGRRAGSATASCRARTRAASCRASPGRGTSSSSAWPAVA